MGNENQECVNINYCLHEIKGGGAKLKEVNNNFSQYCLEKGHLHLCMDFLQTLHIDNLTYTSY